MDSIKVKLFKGNLIHLICGQYCFRGGDGEADKYKKFTGNQWNEEWSWDRMELGKLSVEELAKMYWGPQFEEAK